MSQYNGTLAYGFQSISDVLNVYEKCQRDNELLSKGLRKGIDYNTNKAPEASSSVAAAHSSVSHKVRFSEADRSNSVPNYRSSRHSGPKSISTTEEKITSSYWYSALNSWATKCVSAFVALLFLVGLFSDESNTNKLRAKSWYLKRVATPTLSGGNEGSHDIHSRVTHGSKIGGLWFISKFLSTSGFFVRRMQMGFWKCVRMCSLGFAKLVTLLSPVSMHVLLICSKVKIFFVGSSGPSSESSVQHKSKKVPINGLMKKDTKVVAKKGKGLVTSHSAIAVSCISAMNSVLSQY